MIELDYRISPEWASSWSEIDIAKASQTDLGYRVLLGDVFLKIGPQDFSAPWGWVPVIDFAAALKMISRRLAQREEESTYDFTESDARLTFRREGDDVIISASYAPGSAAVPLPEFVEAIDRFAQRVLSELKKKYPQLAANISLRQFFPD